MIYVKENCTVSEEGCEDILGIPASEDCVDANSPITYGALE